MAYSKEKKKRISKLAFPSRVKINEIKSLFGFFFTYIYKQKKKGGDGEDFQCFFFLYKAIKKMYVCVHKQQRTDVTRKDNEN